MLLVACGGSSKWTWDEAKKDGVLNYVLLIGQIDHNDSAARTAGIRDALGTRGTKTLIKKALSKANSPLVELSSKQSNSNMPNKKHKVAQLGIKQLRHQPPKLGLTSTVKKSTSSSLTTTGWPKVQSVHQTGVKEPQSLGMTQTFNFF